MPVGHRTARDRLQQAGQGPETKETVMSTDKEAADAMLGAVKRRAMEVVELPEAEREGRYKIYRHAYIEAGSQHGLTRQKAHEMAEKMNNWTRALVTTIEQSGSAKGGHA